MQAQHLLRYAPSGIGLTVALFYGVTDSSVYGWYVGAAGSRYRAAFFALLHFYADPQPTFARSIEDDLYGAWLQDAHGRAMRVHSPLSDAIALDLARLQAAFLAEWLVVDGQSAALDDALVHYPGPMSLRSVDLPRAQLQRLQDVGPVSQHASSGLDFAVVRYLAAHWNIDARGDPLPALRAERHVRVAPSRYPDGESDAALTQRLERQR